MEGGFKLRRGLDEEDEEDDDDASYFILVFILKLK